jgi:hypothetical protein
MVLTAPENAPRIRTAIQQLRSQLQKAKNREGVALLGVLSLNRLIDDGVVEITRASKLCEDSDARRSLPGIADSAIRRLTSVRNLWHKSLV